MERGYQTADDPQPCPRCRGQQHQVVPVGQCRVVVGDREPDGDTTVARREQTGAARLPHEAAKFDVQEEQIAAAGIRIRVAGRGPQSLCGLLGRGNLPQGGEWWFRPCRAPGGDRPDALSGAESAVRRDRRPRDRQPRPAQFPVGERALPEAHGPVGHAQGASDAAGCHVADREKPAVRPGDPGADAAVPRAGDHGFGEQAVQAQRAVRAVRPA